MATGLVLSMLSLAAAAKVAHVDAGVDGDVIGTVRGGAVFSNSESPFDVGALASTKVIYVDANAPSDPFPGDPQAGDPYEDGTPGHPFDSVFEAMAVAADGDTILVAPGHYAPVDAQSSRLEFAGRNIRLVSCHETDFTQIGRTVLDASIVFDGTEGPQCELAGFKIQGPAFEGISGNGTAATLRYCVIQGNSTCDGSVVTDFRGRMTNCLIADNTTAFECGSRPAVEGFSGTMTNCTIAGNATGVSVDIATIVNCIFYYHNGAHAVRVQDHGSLEMAHSCLQGGEQAILASDTATLGLESIMAANPRFVRLGRRENGQLQEGDYRLQSQGSRWNSDATGQHWVRDAVTSPCIDGGDPSMDIGAEAVGFAPGMGAQSQVNWRINMGCYGGTAQASLPFVDQIPGPITATASSSEQEDAGPEKTCDGSGLNANDEHSTMAADMWLSDEADETPWVVYEFDQVYVVCEMWVWNHNVLFELMLGFGAKDVTVEYSENGTDWTALGDVQFAQAPALGNYTANTIVPLGGVSARYVRLKIWSSWGLTGSTGLSEVRFLVNRTPRPVAEEIPRAASDPDPADGRTDVLVPVILSWTPGSQAATRDVYLGADFDAVSKAQTTNPSGVLIASAHDANSLHVETPLEPGQTYYWRVDETTSPPASTVTMGYVWSFTVSPYAYPIRDVVATSNAISDEDTGPENTVNGSGLNANDEHSTKNTDMWLGEPGDEPVYIQFEFDTAYELSEMWVWNYNAMFESMLGLGVKDATIEYSENGADWTVLGDVQFAQGTAEADYTANTIVPLGGVSAKYVRLADLDNWGIVDDVGLSEVRFYAGKAPVSPISSYTLVLDSFETYNDDDWRIYIVWTDGYGLAENGSVVGHLVAPFAEREIVHSGRQSMPLFYDNRRSFSYSEASKDLEVEHQDWLVDDAEALTLYFRGSTEKDHNTETDRLYLAIEDDQDRRAMVYHPTPEALLRDGWQKWTISFDEFSQVDLHHVKRLTLGVGDSSNPQRGGESVIYFDDIGLTAAQEGGVEE